VFILKELKVVCFDTLLEVFILKVLRCVFLTGFSSADSKGLAGKEFGDGELES
jgi:hypothetical protein